MSMEMTRDSERDELVAHKLTQVLAALKSVRRNLYEEQLPPEDLFTRSVERLSEIIDQLNATQKNVAVQEIGGRQV